MPEPFPLPAASQRQGGPRARGRRRRAGVGLHLGLALVPAALVACLGLTAVTVLIVAGPSSPEARLTLVITAAGAMVVLCAAAAAAQTASRQEHRTPGQPASGLADEWRRLGDLVLLASHGRAEMRGLTERIKAGETPPERRADPPPVASGDPLVRLAQEIHNARTEAWNAVLDAASANPGGGARRLEVFLNLARRMQTLSHRAIRGLDELENQVEDPDLLKGLFRVDHLSTRLRRQAESLAVIGGGASRRRWSRPVPVYEVLRSAVAEVEDYNRVKVVPPVEGELLGSAVADLIHLLAELVENATRFSPPHTQVLLRAETVTAGLAIEIEDRGLGIPRETQRRLNDLLADPGRVDGDELVRDGRIGLLVVAALAQRHKVALRLQTNMFGGTQAVLVIPNDLIGPAREETGERAVPLPAEPPAGTSSSTPFPGPGQDPTHGDHHPAASARRTEEPVDNGDRRPELPRRRPQANMAPELVSAPAPRDDDAAIGHDHGLMAAFKKGMRGGQETGQADGPSTPNP
ncbi:hypothetical protein GCM10010191_50560 [Actinomadura vinacea]|uniref:histidine kinase n=1 Tax=Actinomadura vinacea TaxID=115336 RepID=A0ABN3JK79_9ACTN